MRLDGEVVTQPDRCVAEVLRVAYRAWTRLFEGLWRVKRLARAPARRS